MWDFSYQALSNLQIMIILNNMEHFREIMQLLCHDPCRAEVVMSSDNDDKNGNKKSINITITADRPKVKRPPLYKVIMLNDDYTPMEFVVYVLQKFFGRSSGEATQIMLNVHQRGVGVCGVYSFEIAESKAQKTIDYARKNDHPLQLQLEKE